MFTQIGRFEIQEKLGEGGMAEVYKAYDPSIDRQLAIKLLRCERCEDSEFRGRFLREAKAAGVLSHANIATVYDVGVIEERPYIVMEYLEGEPLDEIIKSGHRHSTEEIVTIGIQLAKALDYAHERGIIHRDVKPANIVRIKDSDVIKVTDFGIARMEDSDTTQQTQVGQVLGTPQYMSPEQVVGQPLTAASDLFSVGVILYQLITGQKAFDADTIGTLLFRITTETPTPIATLAPDIPASLQRIVEKLLNKKPEKRFQSGMDTAKALIKVLGELQEMARDKDRQRIIPIRIKWSLVMAGVVAVAMLVSCVVIYKKQHKLILGRIIASGSSLAKFIAGESAVPMLSEDWVAIELFVQDVMERQDFAYLRIVDHNGILRGTSKSEAFGSPLEPVQGRELANAGDVVVVEHLLDGQEVLDFQVPILFQNRPIGKVYLGIPEAPFQEATNTTIYMMAILMLVTIFASIVATFFLASRLAAPIRATVEGMEEVAMGNYDFRIAEKRTDEFERLFEAFNRMAAKLEQITDQQGEPGDASAPEDDV